MSFARPLADIRVGGEVDAICTKCKVTTNHRIVAMVENQIKRVICLTCNSEHNYRRPDKVKKTTGTTTKAPRERRKSAVDEGEAIFKQWQEKQKDLGSGETTPYTLTGLYEKDQALVHSVFGLGFVTAVLSPQKVEVMFERVNKILAMHVSGK